VPSFSPVNEARTKISFERQPRDGAALRKQSGLSPFANGLGTPVLAMPARSKT